MATGANWSRLGRHITTRRVGLGMGSVRELAEMTKLVSKDGVTERTLSKIENGKSRAYPSTLAVIELALQWEPGSAQDILDGLAPTDTPASDDRPPVVRDNWHHPEVQIVWNEKRLKLPVRLGFVRWWVGQQQADDGEAQAVLCERNGTSESDDPDGPPSGDIVLHRVS